MSRHAKVTLAVGVVVVLLGVAFWLISSGGQTEESRQKEALPQTVTVGLAGLGEISTLDPARAGETATVTIVWQLYDRLVSIRPDGSVGPSLARDWVSTEDLRTWRFALRSDAFFHSGDGASRRQVTVEDAKASIERALRIPGFAQSLLGDLVVGAAPFIAGESSDLPGLRIESGELVLELSRPFAFLPERLASSFFSVVPRGTPLEGANPPIGSGPYRLARWDRTGQAAVVERIDRGWDPISRDSPQRLIFRTAASEGLGVVELGSGAIDWLETTITALPLLQAEARRSRIRIWTPPQNDVRMVALNISRTPFRDGFAMARALNLATDRSAIRSVLGGGVPVGGPVPGGATGREFTFDLRRAKELVAQVPADGRQLQLLVQPGDESRLIAEVLKRNWGAAGLGVELVPGRANFFDRLVSGDYQLALAYYGPFLAHPEQYLWPYRSTAQPVPNVMGFSSRSFDTAFERYTSSSSDLARADALRDAVGVLLDNPPVVWLVRAPLAVGTRLNLKFPRLGSTPLFYRAERSGD